MYLFFSFSQAAVKPHEKLENRSDVFTKVKKLIKRKSKITHGQILFTLLKLDAKTFTQSRDEDTRRNSLSATYLREVFGITFHLRDNKEMYLNKDACPFLQETSYIDSKFKEAVDTKSMDRFFSNCFDPSDNCFDALTDTILKTKFVKNYTYETCSIFEGLKPLELNQDNMEHFFDMFERHNQLLFWDFLMSKQVDFDSKVPLSELNADLDELITKLKADEDILIEGRQGFNNKFRPIDIIQVLAPINVPLFIRVISNYIDEEIGMTRLMLLYLLFPSSAIIDVLKDIKDSNNQLIASKKCTNLISSLKNSHKIRENSLEEIEKKQKPSMIDTLNNISKRKATNTNHLTKDEIQTILETIEQTNPGSRSLKTLSHR